MNDKPVSTEETATPKGRPVKVSRDLRAATHYLLQKALYEPCHCGSGNKFKFCCYSKR